MRAYRSRIEADWKFNLKFTHYYLKSCVSIKSPGIGKDNTSKNEWKMKKGKKLV